MKKRIVLYVALFQVVVIGAIVFRAVQGQQVSVTTVEGMSVGPTVIQHLPHYYEPASGISVDTDLSHMGEGYNYTVTNHFNKDTLHQWGEVRLQKGKDVFRIVTIGDSFTYGANVNTQESYPSQLQELFDNQCNSGKKVEILNLGVPGYDIEYTVERLKLRGLKYDPDLILWLMIPDHLTRINKLVAEKAGAFRQQMIETPEGRKTLERAPYTHLYKARELVLWELGEEKVMDYQKALFEKLGELYKGPLVFMAFSDNGFTAAQRALLDEVSGKLPGSFYFDRIRSLKEYDGLLADGHPNKNGHAIIAEDILQYLTEKKLIVCG